MLTGSRSLFCELGGCVLVGSNMSGNSVLRMSGGSQITSALNSLRAACQHSAVSRPRRVFLWESKVYLLTMSCTQRDA